MEAACGRSFRTDETRVAFAAARSCWRPLAGKETDGGVGVHPWTCARLAARL